MSLLDSKPTPTITPEVIPPVVATTVATSPPKSMAYLMPANWHLKEVEEGVYEGYNNSTMDTFEGSMADFNAMLRS